MGSDKRCRDAYRHKQEPTAPARRVVACAALRPGRAMPVAPHTQEVQEAAVWLVVYLECWTEMGLMGGGDRMRTRGGHRGA